MKLREYLDSLDPEQKIAFAGRADTSLVYLYHITAGRKKPSLKLCRKLAAASSKKISLAELRPDLAEAFA